MDLLKIYLADVARTPLISADAERELSRRARAGDLEARNALVTANLRLAVSVARQFKAQKVPLEDLIQAANVGLLRAVERYDPDRLSPAGKPYKFSTYATWWLRNFLRVECWILRSIIRVPGHLRKRWSELAPDVERVMLTTPIDAEIVSEDSLADPWDAFEELGETEYRNMQATRLRLGMARLSERQRCIVTGRMNGLKFREIGEQLGITKERVRQIQVRSFQDLREFLLDEAA